MWSIMPLQVLGALQSWVLQSSATRGNHLALQLGATRDGGAACSLRSGDVFVPAYAHWLHITPFTIAIICILHYSTARPLKGEYFHVQIKISLNRSTVAQVTSVLLRKCTNMKIIHTLVRTYLVHFQAMQSSCQPQHMHQAWPVTLESDLPVCQAVT